MMRKLTEQENKARQKAFLKDDFNVDHPGECFEAGFIAGLEYQQARIDELAEILQPFAEAADAWDKAAPGRQRLNITLTDLSRVRAAIAKVREQ